MHSLSGCHGMRRWHLAQFPSFTRPYAKCAIATKRWRLGSCAVSCAAIIRYLHNRKGETNMTESLPKKNSSNCQADWWGLRASACATLALLLALLPMDAAEAARSGGRMGGSRSFAARPGPRVGSRGFGGPRVSGGGFGGPRVSIGIGSPLIAPMSPFGVAPLSPFGYGFGVPVPLGSIGPSPGSGPSVNDQMLQNQQVQDERKIDEQKQGEIATLKKELEELKLQSK